MALGLDAGLGEAGINQWQRLIGKCYLQETRSTGSGLVKGEHRLEKWGESLLFLGKGTIFIVEAIEQN